jgi:spermidine synthase
LASYFGNTIFTVSSAISVILLALSLGYYFGGRIADAKATEDVFYKIIMASGVSVIILYLLNLFVIPKIGYSLSLREGPPIVSLILFFIPGLLLGLLSPIVVALQNKKLKEGIGKTTGDVFFWSTLGSILGSLSSGYILIPFFGIDKIIVGVGILLFIIALFGLISFKSNMLKFFTLMFFLIFFLILFNELVSISFKMNNSASLHSVEGLYGNIEIYDGLYRNKPARFLRQDIDNSSAMYHNSPELVYNYTKYYALYKLVNPDIERALVIGGGAYSVPMALLRDDPDVIVDVAEIEPDLFLLAQKYFSVTNDKRILNHTEDGRRILYDTANKYDLIFSDAFSYTIPSHMTTREFFRLSKSKLKNEGLFIMNIIDNLDYVTPSFAMSEIRTFLSVYPNSYFFAVTSPEFDKAQNIILAGYNSNKELKIESIRATDDTFFDSLSIHQFFPVHSDLMKHSIFTDNYAPVDYYISTRL